MRECTCLRSPSGRWVSSLHGLLPVCQLAAAHQDHILVVTREQWLLLIGRCAACMCDAGGQAGAPQSCKPARLGVHIGLPPLHAGGLLAAHVLLLRAPAQEPKYAGGLLPLAARLADALLPAFDTPSGIPLSWVNLVQVRLGPRCMGLQAPIRPVSLEDECLAGVDRGRAHACAACWHQRKQAVCCVLQLSGSQIVKQPRALLHAPRRLLPAHRACCRGRRA